MEGGGEQIATETMSGEAEVQKKEQIVFGLLLLLPLQQMEPVSRRMDECAHCCGCRLAGSAPGRRPEHVAQGVKEMTAIIPNVPFASGVLCSDGCAL